MKLKTSCVAALAMTSLIATTGRPAFAAGETVYDPDYCGGPDGSPAPTFSPFTDLPYLLGRIATYSANPALLFGPTDHWTNWWRELDMRNSLGKLAVMRGILDKYNLWDMYVGWFPTAACAPDALTSRQSNGTCNDLAQPAMGAAGIRFGRNMVPFQPAAKPDPATFLSPNPREVSRVLFTRDEFKPVPFLNMMAAAWVQFQVHDWFAHQNSSTEFWQIPLDVDDPLRDEGYTQLTVPKTASDPTRQPWETVLPPSYPNQVTHWWDGSQLYGSDAATTDRLRTHEGGHMKLGADGLLPKAADGFEDTGMRQNWWLGLALLHNLFTQEHNAIADMLHQAYPTWTDDQLFAKARLINAALIAKIHTVEWTPAILPNPSLETGMNANWFGLNKYMSPKLAALPPGVPASFKPVLFGVVGGARDLKTNPSTGAPVPYTLTEEFVSVYRMHPLLPEEIEVFQVNPPGGSGGHRHGEKVKLKNARNDKARKLEEKFGVGDLLYSFGIAHPGALVLNNYPDFLQNLKVPVLGVMDMGAVDILRDRERGIPRYNEFRRQLRLQPLGSLAELTDDPVLLGELQEVYGTDAGAIERVDLLVGTLAESTRPTCYGFGETLFQVFTLMATRRLQADRFYTDDFRPEIYTPEGIAWVQGTTMKDVLLRHYPELGDTGLAGVTNAFYPWE